MDKEKISSRGDESIVQVEVEEARHRTMFSWLRIGISAILLVALFLYVDLTEIWGLLREANWEFVGFLFALLLGLRFYSAYRWFVLLHGKNSRITFKMVLHLTFISVFLGSFMPGGPELIRIYLLSKMTSDLALTFSSLLVERTLALVALFVLVLFGLLIAPPGLPVILGYGAWLGLLLLAIGSLTVMNPRSRIVIDKQLSSRLMAPIRKRLAKLYSQLDSYADQIPLMLWAMVLAFGMQLLRIGCTIVGALALGIQLPIITYLVVVPLIFLVALMPISVGGLGVRETAFVTLFGLVGVSPEAAFTLSLLLYVISMVTTIPGAYLYMAGGSASGSFSKTWTDKK